VATKFSELRNKMPLADQKAAKRRAARIIKELPLDELRQAMDFTQERLAASLNIKQSSISKIEKQTDMFVSTLRKYIEAIGGTLEISANLPNGTVRIAKFARAKRVRR
jgi:DNA-binding XRE family transcriptional regulator